MPRSEFVDTFLQIPITPCIPLCPMCLISNTTYAWINICILITVYVFYYSRITRFAVGQDRTLPIY